jgi:hypothetical protein
MSKRDDVLPTHDYFIYVPVTREENPIFDELPASKSIWRPEDVNVPELDLSWTRIALADTVDVYARF